MADLMTLAEKEAERIRKELKDLERVCADVPEGRLKCSTRNTRKIYFIVKTENGKRHVRYIPVKQIGVAESLAMRDYCIKKKRMLERNLACLEALRDNYSRHPDITAAGNMNPDHFALIKDKVFPKEDELRAWQDSHYDRNSKHPETLVQRTLCGIMVRSKSESIIADQLFRRGIPFRYEAQMFIDGWEFYPDLLILHPKDRRTLIWEHFGLMSNESYRINTFRKLALYSEAGFELGRDLIATFEWDDAPLDPSYVAILIDHYFEQ